MAEKVKRPREEIEPTAMAVSLWLWKECQLRCEVAGSLRRGRNEIGDVDLVVGHASLRDVCNCIVLWGERASVSVEVVSNLEKATKTADVMVGGDILFNLYYSTDEAWGAMLLFLTGSQKFNILMRTKAKKEGYKLNQYGLWHGETLIAAKEEDLIFQALGMKFVSPNDRDVYGDPRKWNKS